MESCSNINAVPPEIKTDLHRDFFFKLEKSREDMLRNHPLTPENS